ncbi:MAG: RNA methyltransferase [Treponema sp.]|nr:RNA methyltransferase [Treponema sp.]
MKNTRTNELAVCGFEAVKALIKEHPQSVRRLYFTKDRAPVFGEMCKFMAKNKRPYNAVDDASELEKLCGSVHHQGVVAMIAQPEIPVLNTDITDEWLHNKESALLLDRVGNANNLGAIVRSAAFFGIKNVIIPIDEAQSSVTTSSYRVAQGGMEYVHIYCIRSITRLLGAMQGKMVRFGTDVHGTIPISEIPVRSKGKPALIVLGNEEHGISDAVKENCDELVTIPAGAVQSGDGQQIESLNVAQAAAIILYECRAR